ncbi:hypothetical protein A4S05_35325 [Nostoc sp. KVJ20]|uniref:hypothetical protein n=1 Tax=Nostoc sp. KVJ20 TaxID=457944 RepID=UPI00083CD1A7|nr:hypothetical protein [Nostoc sp. KVJ20]ODG99993.1 hypothetical protein A4S05_35325 [Nostoc sp. KVJ20]
MKLFKYPIKLASSCFATCVIASTAAVIAQPKSPQTNSVIKLTPTQLKVLRSLAADCLPVFNLSRIFSRIAE